MNLNQLRTFYSVIKKGTFTKAAQELNVTEPAVFIGVRSLERYLGYTLLDRVGKELKPTQTGEILYDYAEKIFGLVDEVTRVVKELHDLEKGFLRLGTARSLAYGMMPHIVSSFRDRYPHIHLFLDEDNSQKLVEEILERHYELAIVTRLTYPEKIHVIPFSTDEIVLIVSPDDRMARKERVSLSELAGEPFICTGEGSSTHATVLKEFGKKNLQPSTVMDARSTELIKQLVKMGKGYAFLPISCVRDEIGKKELSTIPVNEGRFLLFVDVVHLKGRTLSPAASTFLGFLQDLKESTNIGKLIDHLTKDAKHA